MRNAILDTPFLNRPKPWWQPLFSVLASLYGIIFGGWDLQPLIFLFWWETLLLLGAAFIRMLFAMDGRPFRETLLSKTVLLAGGLFIGTVLMMLTVAFTFNAFESPVQADSFKGIQGESMALNISYALGLILHFFGNHRYKTASPAGELTIGFAHVFVILAPLQVLTMHLIPKYPQINQALWATAALVAVKFVVDSLFMRLNKTSVLK